MKKITVDRRAFIAGAAAAPVVGASQATGQRSRAWQVGERGGFDTMRLVSRKVSAPGPDEVLIDVAASGIAGRDRAIARGWFLNDKPPELIPLSEGVGTIAAVGDTVTRLKVGDRVICGHFANWVDGPWTPDNYRADVGNTIDGWLAEQVLLPVSGVAVVPDAISDVTAATLSGSAVTAWHALHEVAQVTNGQTVLSLGTGGVSSWGLLLAKAAGARVVVTSSSDDKLERMRKLGADVTVNYRTDPEWGKVVMEQTGGVDVVLENVGRATLDQSMHAAGNNAVIVMIGTGPLPEQLPKMPGFYIKNLAMKAISNGSRRMLEDLMRGIVASGLEAVVDHVFDFEAAIEAFTFMDKSTHVGKVVIRHG